jgi:DNA mismatch repair ATPase MutS
MHQRTGRFALDLYKPEDLMRLDLAAQNALHVFPARGESLNNNTTSIYGILNHTRTAMGKRLLRSWLKQPLLDVRAITERHTVVAAFVDDAEMRCAFRVIYACACLSVRASECRAACILSFYRILNHTRTAMGKRLQRSWLPFRDVRAITERHTVVAAFVNDAEILCSCPCICCAVYACPTLSVRAFGCRAACIMTFSRADTVV